MLYWSRHEFPMPVIGNLFIKQGLLQFLCTSLYGVGCRRKIDGRYWQMCRLYINSVQDIPLNPSRSKALQVFVIKVSCPKGNLPVKYILIEFVQLQLSAYEVDNVEIDNIE